MRLLLALLTSLAAVAPARAQESTAGFLFAYSPHDRSTFEPGYRRHLEWHRANADSLTWYGWDVLVGPRPGVFVDGVFGVPFAALDARVDPAGDQADAAVNVLPHADVLARELLVLRPRLGTAIPLEDGTPTPLVQVQRYAVSPEGFARMEAALSSLRERAADGSLLPYTVYERVAGAGAGFVLMIWRERLATFDEHGRNPARALHELLAMADEAAGSSTIVRAVESEIWLYRRDLTHRGSSTEVR